MISLVFRPSKNQSKMIMINLSRKKSNLQRFKLKKSLRNHKIQKTKNLKRR